MALGLLSYLSGIGITAILDVGTCLLLPALRIWTFSVTEASRTPSGASNQASRDLPFGYYYEAGPLTIILEALYCGSTTTSTGTSIS